jgi:hypothetical protein
MSSRYFFGALLLVVGVLYLWLAWMSLAPQLQNGDFASYLGLIIFLAAGVGAAFAGINLLRTKRR